MATKSNSPDEHDSKQVLANLQRKIRQAETLYSSMVEAVQTAEKHAMGIELSVHEDGTVKAVPIDEIPAGECYVVRR